jgi:hypothetical protein
MKKMKPKLSHAQKGVSSSQNGISTWLGRERVFFELALMAVLFINKKN